MHSLPPRERASDQRLDSKGDAWRRYGAGSGLRAPIPPPCEVRRNFDSLQEYISEQQPTFFKRSHPSELFGDRWLDLKGKDPVHGRRQSTYADQNGMYKMLTHSHEYDLRETRPTGPTSDDPLCHMTRAHADRRVQPAPARDKQEPSRATAPQARAHTQPYPPCRSQQEVRPGHRVPGLSSPTLAQRSHV